MGGLGMGGSLSWNCNLEIVREILFIHLFLQIVFIINHQWLYIITLGAALLVVCFASILFLFFSRGGGWDGYFFYMIISRSEDCKGSVLSTLLMKET